MRVRLRFFAALREQLGTSATRTVPAGTSVGTLWRALVRERPELGRMRVRFAVNQEYVDDSHALSDDDEVAFMPPVSGGSR
jgi:molybdopterin converting factor subunit 1